MSTIDEARNAPKPPVVEKDPRETHVFHVTISKGHSKPETRKATIRTVHGKDHALKTAIAHYENDGFKVHDHKTVKESYDDNRTGFTKKKREDDEYHNEPKPKFKAKSTMDRPHTVHVDGKPWKKFDNGHQAHAAANTLRAKGKKATAIAHFKEHIEEIDEARMTAAMKLQNAFQREQEKSAAARKAGEELLKKKEEPKKTNEDVESIDEALDPSEVAGNPRMYSADIAKKAYYHKRASESDKESLARHLDRHHGNKNWRKPVKEDVELVEGIQIHPDRYIRSHGKKPSGGHGLWMFTHKHAGGVDYNDKSQVHSAQGNYSDAKKSAAKWAAEHGHKKVYVMESIDEGLKPHHNMRPGWMLKADPELAKKVKANKELAKKRQASYGNPDAGKSVKEDHELTEGAYEKAEENKKSADAAKKQGDMFAHHLHMADHHDNMSQWHSEKGRHGEADKHAEKAEHHHEEAMKLKEEVAANNTGGNVAGLKGDAGKKSVLTNKPLKRFKDVLNVDAKLST